MRVKISKCRSCGARCFFAATEAGKTMIVDREVIVPGVTLDRNGKPIPEGNIALEDRGATDNYGNRIPTAIVNAPPSLFGENIRYVDHHVRCPQSDFWTQKAKERKKV